MTGNENDHGIHRQVLESRGKQYRSIDAIRRALANALARSANALTDSGIGAEGQRTLHVGEPLPLQCEINRFRLQASLDLLTCGILPLFVSRKTPARHEFL